MTDSIFTLVLQSKRIDNWLKATVNKVNGLDKYIPVNDNFFLGALWDRCVQNRHLQEVFESSVELGVVQVWGNVYKYLKTGLYYM